MEPKFFAVLIAIGCSHVCLGGHYKVVTISGGHLNIDGVTQGYGINGAYWGKSYVGTYDREPGSCAAGGIIRFNFEWVRAEIRNNGGAGWQLGKKK
jgi:hypothetical protein